MDIDRAYKHLVDRLSIDRGRFYGGKGDTLPIGAGLVYDRIRFPVFQEEERLFATAEGLVYLLTHECDVSQENQRLFNNSLLVCPIISLEHFVEEYSEEYTDDALLSFLDALARRKVYRIIYIPTICPQLPYGGLLNLNEIGHTSILEFQQEEVERLCSVSSYGADVIDKAMENHLLRPKSVPLPLNY
ncbi:hypothetical protein M0534_11660 [Methylonatrum kenyense]|uniref:hypothetical protein n=1 Tax=Methylonatrum kenyense TaxID=455253 RepID=UPI0020BE03E9|nr:hypothetical protein [Methylonatrum kenyense]MCK8516976.1 hypothetical protein [Methylonatrum kenyense]